MASSKMVQQVICPNCRTTNIHGSPYCGRCGAPLGSLPAGFARANEEAAPPDTQDDVLKNFLNEEQDEALVRQIYLKALHIMTGGEEIEYIATANKSVVGSAPACVVATNKRLIDYKRKLLGKVEMDDCSWRDVREAQLREGRNGVTLVVETIQGWKLTADSLPRAQARRLFEVGAEHNVRLQARLQEMLEAASASEQDATLAQEAAASIIDTPQQPQQEQVSTPGDTQRENPDVVDGPTMPDAGLSSTGPLRLVLPEMEPDTVESWQSQPLSHNEPLRVLPFSHDPQPNEVGGLDDLLAPLLGKEAPGARRGGERLTMEPAAGAQVEHNDVAEESVEPLRYAVAGAQAPAHLVTYQVSTPNSAHNGASNGANNSSRASDEGGQHLPGSNGLVAAALLQSEPEEATPRTPAAPMPHTQEPSRAEPTVDASAQHKDSAKVSASKESPMRKLKQLKRMMEVGLITEADYEAKKAEILSRM